MILIEDKTQLFFLPTAGLISNDNGHTYLTLAFLFWGVAFRVD